MNSVTDTRTKILDVAQDMLQRQSISGVSFQELANRVGIKKGSMYYHFESKDSLTIAILERATNDLRASFRKGREKSATDQLNYFFEIWSRFIGVGEKVCPGGVFAGEWETLSEEVKAQAHKLIEVQIQGVKEILEQGIEASEFNAKGQSAEALARWIISSIQGSLITCRIMENSQNFDTVVSIIRQYLGLTKTK